MKLAIVLLFTTLFFACNRQTTLKKIPITEIEDLKIKKLHQLMQGSFVIHSEGENNELEPWKVTGVDSVILYTTFLGDTTQEEYWLYSYEFMTSLPNDPIYTSIKRIEQIAVDTYLVSYYHPPREFNLQEVLIDNYISREINVNRLSAMDKKVSYTYEPSFAYKGRSIIYEDKKCHCLRENFYYISPLYYKVNTVFYSKKENIKIDRRQQSKILVRREIEKNLLWNIAQKVYNLK